MSFSSSDSSSSDSSSTSVPESLSKYNFDPFAVHSFTNCSVECKSQPLAPGKTPSQAYPYRYGPSLSNYDTPHVQNSPPSCPPSSKDAMTTSSPVPKSPPLSPSRKTGPFVPFRKETASPDLADILKNGSSPKSYSFQDTTRTMTTTGGHGATPIPLSHGRLNK